jgi:hypothetical protein
MIVAIVSQHWRATVEDEDQLTELVAEFEQKTRDAIELEARFAEPLEEGDPEVVFRGVRCIIVEDDGEEEE